MKADTLRRRFRKFGIKFVALPDESTRWYSPSSYQQVRHAEYYRTLTDRHPRYQPRSKYKVAEDPVYPRRPKLTSYALSLIS